MAYPYKEKSKVIIGPKKNNIILAWLGVIYSFINNLFYIIFILYNYNY